MAADLKDLVATSHRTRLRAIRDLNASPGDDTLLYALRRVVFADGHAEVRAVAARKLGRLGGRHVEAWLHDAIADRSPLVRDSVVRGLARCGTTASVPTLRRLVETDRMWWVRRAAIYALAAIAGASEVPTFKAALADPFWRVRHAAVKVLAVLGARDIDVRDEVIAGPPSSTLTFLRAAWGPVAIESPDRATSTTSLLPAALLDADPAVVTARLAALPVTALAPLALVEMLCDPHAPLRILAAERLADSNDTAAYIAALDWFEAFRIPHVADTVDHLLDSLGDRALAVATHALAQPDRPGGAQWAIDWVIATGVDELREAALVRARADRHLRRAALPLAGHTELLGWAREDAELVDAIAVELHARRQPDALDALLQLDAGHPRTRALQVDVQARRDAWPALEAALADDHHGPRAIATRWLVRGPDSARFDALLADPDPAVREAALTRASAARLVADRDPFTSRAAIQLLAAAWTHAGGETAMPDEVSAAARLALADRDPWMRAQACSFALAGAGADLLGLVVECLTDREDSVRAAAADALARGGNMPARLRALVASPAALSEAARAMAYAWLLRELDAADGEVARAALADESPDTRTHAVLHAVAELHGLVPPLARAPRVEHAHPATPARVVPVVERRPFGRAGFAVPPLAISGAFDLQPAALHKAADAGAELFFWEPSYDGLTRFLRTSPARTRTRVIAGTYHAEPESIELDVDRALRRLRRDTLDVFLLFWSRSMARIDADAFAILERLKRSGKVRAVGFSTHHRELARTAIAASPWDVVMIRHSAAHPGIETELLPVARATNTAIITFSALCYGRMLSGPAAPTAADCYRYSLSQDGVTACISAPRREDELVENLDVLRAPILEAPALAALRAHGIGVRAENQRFNTLLRQPTRDAATAAREMLAAELPPDDVVESRPLPRAGASRGARTNLGSARRKR